MFASPFSDAFFYLRRPKLTHTIQAYPSQQGSQLHALVGGAVVKSPGPTMVQHHLFRSTAPLEMPRPKHLWMLFVCGVGISTLCLLPLTILGANALTLLLAVAIVLPAWLIGFSTPVFAWWSITSRHMGIHISRRDAEWILAAGMLSTIPAIVINSVISPILVSLVGLDAAASGTLGEGLICSCRLPSGKKSRKCWPCSPQPSDRLAQARVLCWFDGRFWFCIVGKCELHLHGVAQRLQQHCLLLYRHPSGLSSYPGMVDRPQWLRHRCWLARGNRLPSLSGTSYLSEDADAN